MTDDDLIKRIRYLLTELKRCLNILFVSNNEKENFIKELLKGDD